MQWSLLPPAGVQTGPFSIFTELWTLPVTLWKYRSLDWTLNRRQTVTSEHRASQCPYSQSHHASCLCPQSSFHPATISHYPSLSDYISTNIPQQVAHWSLVGNILLFIKLLCYFSLISLSFFFHILLILIFSFDKWIGLTPVGYKMKDDLILLSDAWFIDVCI